MGEEDFKLVCFDMDGTLIRNTNSVRYLCELNDELDSLLEIEEREARKEISWIESDYIKAGLIKGLKMEKVVGSFNTYIKLIDNIEHVIRHIKEQGMKCILVTAGPIQVADIVGGKFGFDKVYGSKYEVLDNAFTGKIIEHMGEEAKLKSLKSYCEEESIEISRCAAVGDSDSDTGVFRECGRAIALNYSDSLIGKADIYLKTGDLREILRYLVKLD